METMTDQVSISDYQAPSLEILPHVKCVVWDLDNTIWHGVLSEGDELVLRDKVVEIIQYLDERGVLHSIASKNNHADAIAKLQEFGLAEYFLFPQINWNAKSTSIERIRRDINIGIDTILFIDDQLFEREEVMLAHSRVECIDAVCIPQLCSMDRVAGGVIADDADQRRLRYIENISRVTEESSFGGAPEAFLATLNMSFHIIRAEQSDLLRAEELTVRTNQLNTTGITYGVEELQKYVSSSQHELWVCELEDRFGTYGKIGLVLVEKKNNVDLIKLLLMSCRVAARGVGNVLLTHLAYEADSRGNKLQAEFKRTDRNRQMLVTFQFAGFTKLDENEQGKVLFEYTGEKNKAYPEYIQVCSDNNY